MQVCACCISFVKIFTWGEGVFVYIIHRGFDEPLPLPHVYKTISMNLVGDNARGRAHTHTRIHARKTTSYKSLC
jgi:hypothetical protein